MTNELIKQKVEKLLKKTFPSADGKIVDTMGPEEITEWDSLTHLNLITEINNEFSINIQFEDVLLINKISDIYKVIDKYNDK